MKQCTACRRHARSAETACPFCGEPLRSAGAGAPLAALLLGALCAACSDRPLDGGSGTETSTGSAPGTTTGGPTTGADTTAAAATTTNGTTAAVTTTTSGEQTTTEGQSGDSGCNFYGGCPTDFGGSPSECDVWLQDCAEGLKCLPVDGDGDGIHDALLCVELPRDPKPLGAPCERGGPDGADECGPGQICWGFSGDDATCHPLCAGSSSDPTCPEEHACVQGGDSVLAVCLPECDPLVQDCQGGEEACIPTPDGENFLCVPDESGATGAPLDACAFSNACDAGNTCLPPNLAPLCDQDADGCCLPFCSVAAGPAPCQAIDPATECVPWFEKDEAPDPEKVDYGVCTAP